MGCSGWCIGEFAMGWRIGCIGELVMGCSAELQNSCYFVNLCTEEEIECVNCRQRREGCVHQRICTVLEFLHCRFASCASHLPWIVNKIHFTCSCCNMVIILFVVLIVNTIMYHLFCFQVTIYYLLTMDSCTVFA